MPSPEALERYALAFELLGLGLVVADLYFPIPPHPGARRIAEGSSMSGERKGPRTRPAEAPAGEEGARARRPAGATPAANPTWSRLATRPPAARPDVEGVLPERRADSGTRSAAVPDIQRSTPPAGEATGRQAEIDFVALVAEFQKTAPDIHAALDLASMPAAWGARWSFRTLEVESAAGRQRHEISIAVALKGGPGSGNGPAGDPGTVSAGDTTMKSLSRSGVTDHQITVRLDTSFQDDPQLSDEVIQDVWRRQLSRTFLHELVHAVLLADQKTAELSAAGTVVSSTGSAPSKAYGVYERLRGGESLQAERAVVSLVLQELASDMELESAKAGELVDNAVEEFIGEKLARVMALQVYGESSIPRDSPAFRAAKSNKEIAELYAFKRVKAFIASGEAAGGKKQQDLPRSVSYYVLRLQEEVPPLLDAIDLELKLAGLESPGREPPTAPPAAAPKPAPAAPPGGARNE